MERGKLIIWILVLVIAGLVILSIVSPGFIADLWSKITGKAVVGGVTCVDNDGGDNPALKGSVEYRNPKLMQIKIFTDECISNDYLREYTCGKDASVVPVKHFCGRYKCSEGACVE